MRALHHMSEPNKPGRPPLDRHDPSVRLSVKIPSRQYDELFQQAQRARVSLPEMVRRKLRRDDTDDDES
jgi:hypothetical protein